MRISNSIFVLWLLSNCKSEPMPLSVLAASDLSRVLPELEKAYHHEFKEHFVYAVGSTGQLAAQIEAGAAVDVFLSADQQRVDTLVKNGRCDQSSQLTFSRGALVLISNENIQSLEGLRSGSIRYVALANPSHAPYGLAASQALKKSDLWNLLEEKWVFANSVIHAQQLAQSHNADAAFVARGNLSETDLFFPIPLNLYDPLNQVAVACGKRENGKQLVSFLKSSTAQQILSQAGFLAPTALSQ